MPNDPVITKALEAADKHLRLTMTEMDLAAARARIEALEAENARLREALEACKPFVDHFKGGWSGHTPGNVSATELFDQITAALERNHP